MKNSLENSFDKFIKSSISDFKAPYDPESWEMLNERMEGTSEPELTEVDDLVRTGLAGLTVPYNESSWDALESKMADLEVAQSLETIDSVAKNTLTGLSVPYDHSTWKILSDRLDQMDYDRKIRALKVVEAAVIILALFTIVRFMGHIPPQQKFVVNEIPSDAGIGVVMDKEDQSSEIVLDISSGEKAETKEQVGNTGTGDVMSDGAHAVVGSNIDGESNAAQVSTLSNRNFYTSKDPARLYAHAEVRENVSELGEIDLRSSKIESAPVSLRSTKAPDVPRVAFSNFVLPDDAQMDESFKPIVVEKESKITTRLSLYRQFNRHSIENDFSWSSSTRKQTIFSKGWGLAAIVNFGRFGFDVGLAYDNLTYDAEYSESEIWAVALPVNFRYSVVDQDFANVYLKGGASYHGVMAADYVDITTTAAPGPRQRFNDGLLHDGFLEDNSYMQWHAGLGVELFAAKKFSLFAESQLQKYWLGELGNTNDKISTISNRVGLNIKL